MHRVRPQHFRRGLTVLELLVCISVVVLLMAILIPAVQMARVSAQTITCRNHFRQLGTAVQQYVALHGQFPRTRTALGSSFVAILPHMDEAQLYGLLAGELEHPRATMFHQPPAFVCPEDPVTNSRKLSTNAAENIGICTYRNPKMATERTHDGVILSPMDPGKATAASVRDGMSNTAVYGEILAYPRPSFSRRIYMHVSDSAQCTNAVSIAERCRTAPVGMETWTFRRGSDWIQGMAQVNQYMHVLPPNEKDCLFTPASASEHRNGAHISLCDGSVRFVSNSVSDEVWQAAGSRAASDGPVEW